MESAGDGGPVAGGHDRDVGRVEAWEDDGPAVVLSVLGRDLVVDDATAEAGRGDAVFVGAEFDDDELARVLGGKVAQLFVGGGVLARTGCRG